MYAEIIAIGTELTSGEKLDTNSQWLSLHLADRGIPVLFHTTVADNLEANVQALQVASQRVEVIILTGGLGPTLDDLTREVLARLAGVELELDQTSLDAITTFFQGRGRVMPERNRIQAMFPAGSTPLPNPIGTAPGIWLELPRSHGTCVIAALPGVPSEMYKMFHEQVAPRLPSSNRVIQRARLQCFGLGESHTEQLLGDLTARGHDPEVGITAHDATITLRIVAEGASAVECQAKIAAASTTARERLGDYIYGTEEDELEDVVIQQLLGAGESVCSVEIGTTGLLSQRLSEAVSRLERQQSGSLPRLFAGGQVLQSYSENNIAALLASWKSQAQADWALGASAVRQEQLSSGPSAVLDLVLIDPAGTVTTTPLGWNGNPAILRSRAAKTLVNMMRLRLLGVARLPE